MKIVVLTTQTTHHTYFVQELVKAFPLEIVFLECHTLKAPFETHHPFEEARDAYEREFFFAGREVRVADWGQTFEVESINDRQVLTRLQEIDPEVIIVFGAGKITPQLIRICPRGIVNLHGGDPEAYRGLDTHLWAIYHRDFAGLVTTLHHLNEELDDGDIILQAALPLTPGMPLHELRRSNTEICVKLTLSALDMYTRHGHFISRPQRALGRYYSFMPAALKEICRIRFEKYTESLR
jgi:methionyl-tRNA formyltransferase